MRPNLLEHAPVLIPLLFLGGAMVTVLAGMFREKMAQPFAVVVTGSAAVLAAFGLARVLSEGTQRYQLGGWPAIIGIELVFDPLSAFLALVICCVALLVLIHARRVVPDELPGKEMPFFAVSLLLCGGLTGIVLTGDLFNLYVFIEILSLSSYALLGVGTKRSPLSAFRYLVMGTTAGSFYLLGLGLIFMRTGTLNMIDLHAIMPSVIHQVPVQVGLAFIAIGLGLKAAVFPLHGWLPDAYTDGSTTATALIAPLGTKAALYAIIRFVYYVVGPEILTATDSVFPTLLAYAGAGAILWGSFMAMSQKELKRMLAYSSVAQVGYIALGIGLMSNYGLMGAVLHILNHAVMKACLFLVSGNLRRQVGHSYLPNIDSSVRRAMPWSMAAFCVAAMSMIGLPPTAGFFSKWYLAVGTVEAGQWPLLAALLVSTLLNAVYFFRIFEQVYLRPAREGASGRAATGEVPPSMLIPTVVFAVLLLLLGIGNALIVSKVIDPMLAGLGMGAS